MRFKIWLAAMIVACSAAPLCGDIFAEEKAIVDSMTSKPGTDIEAGRRELAKMREEGEKRKPVLDRTRVFVRSQTKYSGMLYKNCYLWHDRPLFASRALWEESESDHKASCFRKTFELYQSYGLDGFATFAWPGPGEYKRTMSVVYDTAAKSGLDPKKFGVMLEVAGEKNYLDISDDKLALITDSPHSLRIGGKSVISSYVIDAIPPEKLAEHVKSLRERSGDRILFLPQICMFAKEVGGARRALVHEIHEAYRKNGGALPAETLDFMREYLRSYLRVADGLYIGHSSALPDITLDKQFSDEVLFPLFKSVLAEPEFNGKKIFAACAKVGYTSYHGTQHLSRDGTKTLRAFFEMALRHKPDLLICPEWDELNEDTGFQPLLAKPMSSQRIIKYYMARLKGEKPSPNPGDDTSIPNLIVSQRRQLSAGWKMDVELLNVPDTDKGGEYAARLELLDESGKCVFSSEEVKFNAAELRDHTFALPSEKFKDCQALRSKIEITRQGKKQVFMDGLPFTVMRPTTCWDQTYFCTPLRNVLRPERAEFKFAAEKSEAAPGVRGVAVEADLRAGEKIAMLEVVQDSLEQFAWDPRNEFLQNDPDRRLLSLGWHYVNNPHRITVEFDVRLENAPSAMTFMPKLHPSTPRTPRVSEQIPAAPAFTEKSGDWNRTKYVGNADHYAKERLISVKKAELEKAVVHISGKRKSGRNQDEPFELTIPLGSFTDYNVFSKVFPDGLMFSLETQYRPVWFPLPVGSNDAIFSTRVMADNPNGVLAARAVTESGKVYWSAPFAVNQAPSKETVAVNVYSDAAGKGVRLDVAKNRVPDIKYEFDPSHGNILFTSAGREFYGHAGGMGSTAIGFTGGEASNYSIPFNLFSTGIFKGADKPAPDWEQQDDGSWALRFDGERGNFLVLPNTFTPQRAGFTLSFELKPDKVKSSQVIFAHQGNTFGGFTLSVKSGVFHIDYVRRTPGDPSQPSYSHKSFRTKVPLLPGKWQKITLAYDESKVTVSAGDKTESIPVEGIGLYLQNSHFGGRGDVAKDGVKPFYKGLLRGIAMRHCE